MLKLPRGNKYRAKPTTVDGIRFASRKESVRYLELKKLQGIGAVKDLELQPAFPIFVNEKKICTYRADFRYVSNGESVVEDVKGMKTPVYRLKKKLVEAFYGIEVRET
jgi:hypothetical protein